ARVLAFDVEERADRTGLDASDHLHERGREAAVEAERERHPGVATGIDRTLRALAGERERLLDEYVLARCRRLHHLLAVLRMRRGEHDRIDLRIAQNVG